MHNKLTEREEYLATQIVDIAIKIHKGLGPGLLESVYEKCFDYELQEREINFQRQREVPIIYKTLHIEDGLRLDLLNSGSWRHSVCSPVDFSEQTASWRCIWV